MGFLPVMEEDMRERGNGKGEELRGKGKGERGKATVLRWGWI
jgi:hypothetical protein